MRACTLAGLSLLLALGQALSAAPAAATVHELPGDSVWNLPGHFADQAGRRFSLSGRRGEPQLVGMFYARCQLVCPLLIETGKSIDRALPADERARLRVLLVSLDPLHDTPQVLARTAGEHGVDTRRWTLARTDGATVRRLAAVLDVHYRQLENGEFNHTSALLLLDGEGRILARTDRLSSTPDPSFIAAVHAALAAH